ncbi:PRA1 family protein [Novymonas esmeraldas]|uniref:PRA1 family protein n=1 Tax=Novymonas esmeraldas TaxID=1808958 RepID=A0AAW0EYI5_9TRYP
MPTSAASDSPRPESSLQTSSGADFQSSASMGIREASSFASSALQLSQGQMMDASAATWGRRGGGSVSGDSDSEFYSEDDSEDSDVLYDSLGSVNLSSARHSRHRHTVHGSRAGSHGAALRTTAPAETQAGGDKSSSRHSLRRMTCSLSSIPLSYFHSSNESSFSFRNELDCYMGHLRHVYTMIEEDRLPWSTDFADLHKMRLPRKAREIASRLNLNIPYYSSNYIELCYAATLPFLLLYNTPFFAVTFLTMMMVHSVRMRKKNTRVYGEYADLLGRQISYRKLGHLLVCAFVMLFMFFNGLRTLFWVVLLNSCIVVPHALMRKPTYFDDEDLEKCRPKMGQYAICLVILALAYLEGDICEDEEAESRRAVELERKRLAKVLAKRETKD